MLIVLLALVVYVPVGTVACVVTTRFTARMMGMSDDAAIISTFFAGVAGAMAVFLSTVQLLTNSYSPAFHTFVSTFLWSLSWSIVPPVFIITGRFLVAVVRLMGNPVAE
jgi:hypothetical protein